MPTFHASAGDDFLIRQNDRGYNGKGQNALKVDGLAATVTVSVPLTATAAVTLPVSTTIGGKTPDTGSYFSVVQAGKNGAGALTLTGALIGDKVIAVANLTTPGDLQAGFETTVTVKDQIQQSSASDLSAKQCLFILHHL
jgi:hypothetical protein